MTADLVITLLVLAATVVLFFWELIPAGQTAMLASAALMLSGVLPAREVFHGFSNVATITVGAMFVISAGLEATGSVEVASAAMGRLLMRGLRPALLAMTTSAGVMSGFVNNTTVVAILLPVITKTSRVAGISASKLLIPLSFASMLGGTCTLIGTSTNLVVSSVAEDHSLTGIGMFELLPVGGIMFVVGVVYLLFIAPHLLPGRRQDEKSLEDSFELGRYITDVRLDADCASVGHPLENSPLLADLDCDVVSIFRDGQAMPGLPEGGTELQTGDVLRVRCAAADVPALLARPGVSIATAREKDGALTPKDVRLVEAAIGLKSALVGRALGKIHFRDRYGALPLAVQQRGRSISERLENVVLKAGDTLLLGVRTGGKAELERHGDFVLVSEVAVTSHRTHLAPVALFILLGVVAAAALGVVSIAPAAVAGALLMIVTGCVRQDEAIAAVDWNVMMLLAGVIALGVAVETSGAADLAARGFVHTVQGLSPALIVGALYLVTALLTNVLSNNATAALLTPVAIVIATRLSLDTRPMVMAVAFGASTAMLTPIGYQTNTLVYGAGRYRFLDFARVGLPLTVALVVVATVMIPVVWPP